MRSIVVLVLAVLASPLAAQQQAKPHLEVGVDFSHWRLGDSFDGASTLRSGTVRAAVLLPGRMPATLGLSATYVPQSGDDQPEMLGFSGEFAQRLGARRPDQLNLFVGAGAGAMRLATESMLIVSSSCTPETPCLDQFGHSVRSAGWRPTLSASAGADVPLLRGSLLQPTLQVVRTFGRERDAGAADVLVRLGVGLAWRP